MSEVILSSLHLVVGKVSSLRGAGWSRRCEVSGSSEHGRRHGPRQPREAAPRCERRCPGAPDGEEERTGDRSEHGGGVFIKNVFSL